MHPSLKDEFICSMNIKNKTKFQESIPIVAEFLMTIIFQLKYNQTKIDLIKLEVVREIS